MEIVATIGVFILWWELSSICSELKGIKYELERIEEIIKPF